MEFDGNMDENIELKLVGITYNQIESGVYALVLEDPLIGRRLAIVIGYPEAQSIECRLQNIRTPRPLTHDLLAKMLNDLGAKLLRVDIHRLPSGPYAGRLTVRSVLGEIFEIDARSSDAIALAIRVGAPIFTNRQLLEKEGYNPKTTPKRKQSPRSPIKEEQESTHGAMEKLTSGFKYGSEYSTSDLHDLLEKYVNEENYEAAAEVKKELDRREHNKSEGAQK